MSIPEQHMCCNCDLCQVALIPSTHS